MLAITAPVAELEERQEERHFKWILINIELYSIQYLLYIFSIYSFKLDDGSQRSEDITFKVKVNSDGHTTEEPKGGETSKPVEYRGGYSFISADGYEYQVRYKANQNGFQPYVTAHKVKPADATAATTKA